MNHFWVWVEGDETVPVARWPQPMRPLPKNTRGMVSEIRAAHILNLSPCIEHHVAEWRFPCAGSLVLINFAGGEGKLDCLTQRVDPDTIT